MTIWGHKSYANAVFVHKSYSDGSFAIQTSLQTGDSFTLGDGTVLHVHSMNITHALVSISLQTNVPALPVWPKYQTRKWVGLKNTTSNNETTTLTSPVALAFRASWFRSARLVFEIAAATPFIPSVTVNGQVVAVNRSLVEGDELAFSVSSPDVVLSGANLTFFSGSSCFPITLTGFLRCGPRLFLTDAREPDLNGDGVVDLLDIVVVINNWGPCSGCLMDLNLDNEINLIDVVLVIDKWGLVQQ